MVIQAGVMSGEIAEYDLLSEEEYLDLMEKLPKDNQFLEDSDPNKFIAKMGAEAIYDLLARLDLDALSYELRHRAGNDASQQRKNEALKRLQVVESFRASRGRNKPEWMIITNNYTTIKVIQVRSSETPTIQRNQRTKFRWNNRYNTYNHPFRLITSTRCIVL